MISDHKTDGVNGGKFHDAKKFQLSQYVETSEFVLAKVYYACRNAVVIFTCPSCQTIDHVTMSDSKCGVIYRLEALCGAYTTLGLKTFSLPITSWEWILQFILGIETSFSLSRTFQDSSQQVSRVSHTIFSLFYDYVLSYRWFA